DRHRMRRVRKPGVAIVAHLVVRVEPRPAAGGDVGSDLVELGLVYEYARVDETTGTLRRLLNRYRDLGRWQGDDGRRQLSSQVALDICDDVRLRPGEHARPAIGVEPCNDEVGTGRGRNVVEVGCGGPGR